MIIPFIPSFKHTKKGRKLFNPITKKTYENRPEERVRLAVLEEIIHAGLWSKNHIGFEIPAKHEVSSLLRTDIICFDRKMQADLLVECKAVDIKLNQKILEQAFRYNQSISAKYVVITNGINEWCFERHATQPENYVPLRRPPYRSTEIKTELDISFWFNAGFIDKTSPKMAAHFIEKNFIKGTQTHWVDAPLYNNSPHFSHYYRQHPISAKHWWSIISTSPTNTWFVEINIEKENPSLIAFYLNIDDPKKDPMLILHYSNGKWQQNHGLFSDFASDLTLEEFKDFLL